ncbi:MAG: asparagine--tRNA ligase [Bacillota bacterium]
MAKSEGVPNLATECRIAGIGKHVGEAVTVHGWVYNMRSSGKLHFVILRDGTGLLQCIISKNDVSGEVFSAASALTQESSVRVSGVVREDKRAPGGYEMHIYDLHVVQLAEDYPIKLKEHGVEFLMDNRHLWLRTPRQASIMRIRHTVVKACRDFLDDRGFLLVDAPILTPAACEGTTTLFETDYFGEKAYLSQSGQLYNEANAMAFGKVYCFGPTFRAEKSKTRRHLVEFWMVEPEIAFCNLEECMRLQEEMITYIVSRVLERNARDLETVERDTEALRRVVPPFPRISYDEAVELLRSKGMDFTWGEDFGAPDETVISEAFDRPVFVHHYPAQCKAFYMQPDPERPELVLSADLLASEGYGEIIGGGQRIHERSVLEERMNEHALPEDPYRWYVDLRRYGSVPHSGFGLGIERTVAWICGTQHVREVIPYPRLLNRIYP